MENRKHLSKEDFNEFTFIDFQNFILFCKANVGLSYEEYHLLANAINTNKRIEKQQGEILLAQLNDRFESIIQPETIPFPTDITATVTYQENPENPLITEFRQTQKLKTECEKTIAELATILGNRFREKWGEDCTKEVLETEKQVILNYLQNNSPDNQFGEFFNNYHLTGDPTFRERILENYYLLKNREELIFNRYNTVVNSYIVSKTLYQYLEFLDDELLVVSIGIKNLVELNGIPSKLVLFSTLGLLPSILEITDNNRKNAAKLLGYLFGDEPATIRPLLSNLLGKAQGKNSPFTEKSIETAISVLQELGIKEPIKELEKRLETIQRSKDK